MQLDVMDTDKIQDLINKANSTIGYLKIITPRYSDNYHYCITITIH